MVRLNRYHRLFGVRSRGCGRSASRLDRSRSVPRLSAATARGRLRPLARRISLRWIALAAALAVGAGAAWWVSGRLAETAHPSILLVTIDTLRADHTSAYGYARPTTPRLAALAERGVRFETAYAPMATTGPSHATMFTALLPRAHGVLKNGQRLAPKHRRLAEVLRDNGYRTAAFVSSFAVHRRFGFEEGFATFGDVFLDHRADQTRARAIGWLKSNGYLDAARVDTPFFLWIHLLDPHEPYDPPAADRAQVSSEPRDGALASTIADYDGEIRFADREMGAIFDALAAVGRFDRLLTIVVGDHGEGLMQHGHMTHGLMIYEETVRVPFVFHFPRRLAPRVIEPPVQIVDLAPTVLELAGLAPEPGFPGQSLAPAMRGEAALDPEQPVYLERRLYETEVVDGLRVAGQKLGVRLGHWKYIEARDEGSYELYDLGSDPGELENLYAAERARSEELARVLRAWADGPAASPAAPVSPEDAERLRALGYVQ